MAVNNEGFGERVQRLRQEHSHCAQDCSGYQNQRDIILFDGVMNGLGTAVQKSFESKIDKSKLTSKQRQRLLVERIFLVIFWVFIALGVVALVLAFTVPIIFQPALIVFGVLFGVGLFGVIVTMAVRTSKAYRRAFGELSLEDPTHKRYHLLSDSEIFNVYSHILGTETDIYYTHLIQEFFYHSRDVKENELQFLSSLYIESAHLFSRIYPLESKEVINKKARDFLKGISASQSTERRLEEVLRLVEDNASGLELVSLLSENAEFSSSALSYVLYKVLEKGLESSQSEAYKRLLVGLGNRSLSLWSLSKWEDNAIPYSLKIILLAAKHSRELQQKIPTILLGIRTTLWQAILASKNKEAMQIFLFNYGGLHCNEQEDPALMVAVQEGYSDVVPFLLDNGCDVVVESKNTQNLDVLDACASLLAKSSKKEVENTIKEILTKAMAARDVSENFQYKVLTTSLELGLGMQFLQTLASLGISPWAKNSLGDTLYSYAVSHNYSEVMEWCLRNDQQEMSDRIEESVNDPELIRMFLNNLPLSESLLKLMSDHGLSLSTVVNSKGENVLQVIARSGNLPVLLRLLQLFKDDTSLPDTEETGKLRENIKAAINLKDHEGNNLLHSLISSGSPDLSSEISGDVLILLMDYGFDRIASVNSGRYTALLKAMMNRKFTFVSMLLNFMSPSDINVGSREGRYMPEIYHPFFIWMTYYKNEPSSEEVMEKMIRKGLNLNYILFPGQRTIKDECLSRNDRKAIFLLKRIHVWENMRRLSEL